MRSIARKSTRLRVTFSKPVNQGIEVPDELRKFTVVGGLVDVLTTRMQMDLGEGLLQVANRLGGGVTDNSGRKNQSCQ